jgi:hypothetical protein
MTLQPQKRALQNGFVFSFRSSQQKWQGRTAPAKVKPSNKHDSCCGVNPLIDTSAASENGPARTSLSPRSEEHFKTARELDVIGLFPHGFKNFLGPNRPNSLDPVELPEAVLPRHEWLPAKRTQRNGNQSRTEKKNNCRSRHLHFRL